MPHSKTEKPDSLQDFVNDLRELRIAAGDPTLSALEARTGVSKSVISDAFVGRRLPTQKTVRQLVDALGGDRTQWLERRARLDPRSSRTEYATPPYSDEAPANTRVSTLQKQIALRTALFLGAGVALVSVIATSIVWGTVIRPISTNTTVAADQTASEYLENADGVDPMQTICREDAVIAASEERLSGDVLVQMMYSNTCMAAWGRVTRYDGQASGNSLSMVIYPATDVNSSRNQKRDAFDVQSIYTPLMIEPNVEARVCGIATVKQAGDPIELGPPICI